ncbi:DUF6146 family protein [Nonlabens marinus]|uniref:Lipoprotein n=1 Tax=Nonlabens marinus S1-08 TaxID=1454201 RepID=W8VSU0_9FLAO|nr:DUF6146 family protein [Nonlabens marinus]BAO56505.1 hypothetical protein NMS_2496 [Nonlabens marinus S1-08]
MRNLAASLLFLIVIVIFASCGGSKDFPVDEVSGVAKDTIRIANDSLEYEIIIIEIGFNSWLATQPPRGYYTQSSMDISNDFKVTEYNLRANDPLRYGANLYPFRIDYDRNVDYGYEVTYLLFNYFKFFEERYNQRL